MQTVPAPQAQPGTSVEQTAQLLRELQAKLPDDFETYTASQVFAFLQQQELDCTLRFAAQLQKQHALAKRERGTPPAAATAPELPHAPAIQASKRAIQELLQRIQRDPRIAYYFDPLTTSFENLTLAHALLWGLNVEDFRAHYGPKLRFESPMCTDCPKGY